MNSMMSDVELRHYLAKNDLQGLLKRCIEIRKEEVERIQRMRKKSRKSQVKNAAKANSQKWREVPKFQRGAARRYANRIVSDSKKVGMDPHLGGGFWEHFQGKLAELIFLKDCRKRKIEVHTPAIRKDYTKLSKSTGADFIIDEKTIEIKSRRNKDKDPHFPYLYPIVQLEENEISDYTIFMEFNAALTQYRYGGFIETYRILSFPKKLDIKLPAYIIQPEDLKTIIEFWRKFK